MLDDEPAGVGGVLRGRDGGGQDDAGREAWNFQSHCDPHSFRSLAGDITSSGV